MNAIPPKRSVHIWIVIALTLVPAAYYTWQLVGAVVMFVGAGATAIYPMYIVLAIQVLILLAVAFAVYRRHRCILFFYLLVVVVVGFDVIVLEPMLWRKAIPVLANSSDPFGMVERQILFALAIPIVQSVAGLYSAIVVYLKIWRMRSTVASKPEMSMEEQRS